MKFKHAVWVSFLLILSLVFSSNAFAAWPFDTKKKTEAPKTAASAAPAAKTQTSAVSSASASNAQSSEDEDEELEEELPSIPEIPQIPQVNVPEIPRIPQTKPAQLAFGGSAAGLGSQNPRQLAQDPEIIRIQAQIREIVKINESLKANFAGQAAEIQKINDQSRIHQKILNKLDADKQSAQTANPENFLNREKVRLIEEQTEKNKKFIADLKNQSAVSSPVKFKTPGTGLPETEKKP